jgi:hypothetical protein
MINKRMLSIGVGAASLFALSAQAAFPPAHCTGQGPVFSPAWDPGNASYQMTAIGGGVYSFDLLPGGDGPGPSKRFEWKATDGTWSYTAPNANAFAIGLNATSITLRLETVARADGFKPDVGVDGMNGITYTIPSLFDGASSVSLVGDFSGWDVTSTTYLLADDGVAPDAAAGDGLYTGLFSLAAGSYGYKVVANGSYDRQLGNQGFADSGNISLNVIGTDPTKFIVDAKTGRVKTESTAPPITYPCALSSAWSQVVGPGTQMFDDGTNGDVVGSDGIFARSFNIATAAGAGVDYMGKVQVYRNGNTYPANGGYPFVAATTGTTVLVSFNTNAVADGYQPSTNIVWVNPNARVLPVTGTIKPLNSVNVTGDFGTDLGASNWNPGDPLLQLADTGASIYALTVPAGANVSGITGKQWKAAGGSWDYQYGSPNEGFTKEGNNANQPITVAAGVDVVFKVDAVLGRAAYGATSLADPVRPALAVFNAGPSAVSDWSMY